MTINFPILRLPRVAFSSVINVADPADLVTLALCSKRAFYLVKSYRKKLRDTEIFMDCESYKASMTIGDDIHALISIPSEFKNLPGMNSNTPQPKEIIFQGHQVQVYNIKDYCHLKFKWIWPADGFRSVIEWLTQLFRMDVGTVSVGSHTIDFIGYVQNRQNTLKSVMLHCDLINEENYRKVLECKAREVTIENRWSISPFEYPPEMFPKRDALVLTAAHWFTSNHLMESDYKHLDIDGSKVTEWDLNRFIKRWLMGGSERLKMLAIGMNEKIDLDIVCDGFHEKLHRLPNKQTIRYMSPVIHTYLLNNAELYIKRDDGTLATIYSSFLRNKLCFVVWPDFRGHTI